MTSSRQLGAQAAAEIDGGAAQRPLLYETRLPALVVKVFARFALARLEEAFGVAGLLP